MEKQEEEVKSRQDQLADDMFASDVDFRNQFDRSNPTYHGGNETAVPINEVKKVPTSMPTEYDPNQQETPKNESYLTDQEYLNTMELRNKFTEMKKIMPRLCSPIEAMLRIKQNTSLILEQLEKALEIEKTKIEEAKQQLTPYITYLESHLEGHPQYKEKYVDELKQCMEVALTHSFKDKEELTDFNFRVKRVSQAVFKEITTLLAEVKKIKARCALADKQQTVQ